VLAVDLDGTLWGGVIGEDGPDGVRLGSEYPGAAYRSLQRAILDLHRRGVVLAICSKNNPPEALEMIERHPSMLLRREHFAAVRINWVDKAQNLREIAAELNVGVDAVALLDDSPVEREWVRGQLPEVTVIELGGDPLGYADTLRLAPVFERISVTEEDRARGRYYAEEGRRKELERSAASLEDFYRSLELKVEVEEVGPQTLARAAQLTQKTNQFNLTTRRYTEAELGELASSPESRVYTLRAADRFGDSGIVGVAITRRENGSCEIDALLMSCRVIGRTIETAFLATIADEAGRAGAERLAGWFLPTAKNAPASGFYGSHGFERVAEDEGATRWELDLAGSTPACPPWIDLRVSVDGLAA
jgi:FkbH-like protein